MLAKLAALVQSKIALAAIGGALVVGGGAAAAAATGNLHIPGVALESHHGDATHTPGDGNHGHTIAINGTLKAYDAGGKTITVNGTKSDECDDNEGQGDDKTPTATKTATAGQCNDDDQGDANDQDDNKTPTASKTPVAHETEGPEASKTPEKTPTTGTFTIAVNGDTKVNGRASTLADLTKAIGGKVQVQAQDDGKGNLTAWKVTVSGDDGSDGSGQGGDHGGQAKSVEGTVGTVNAGAGTFTLKPQSGSAITVHVSTQTKFDGSVHNLAGLKSGMHVQVQGTTQSDGSIAAAQVEASGSDGGSGH